MNDHGSHLDDDAELYALGMLDDRDRVRADNHVRECVPCAQRLGRAEATVAAMVESQLEEPIRVATPRRRNVPAWGALAAAVALALWGGAVTERNAVHVAGLRSDGSALEMLVRSHFVHAQFHAPDGTPIAAKAIYERHGRWYEIIALDPQPSWHVEIVRDGGPPVALGTPFARRGTMGLIVLRNPGVVRELRILDGSGWLVGRVRPTLIR